MSRPDKIPLNTTLDLVTHAVVAFLAAREDPGRNAANVPIRRIVREELERVHPGAWDRLVQTAAELSTDTSPREQSVMLAGELAAIFRGRGEK